MYFKRTILMCEKLLTERPLKNTEHKVMVYFLMMKCACLKLYESTIMDEWRKNKTIPNAHIFMRWSIQTFLKHLTMSNTVINSIHM